MTKISNVPDNIREFNTVAGLVFAQLYAAFPVTVERINRDEIARSLGASDPDLYAHRLASGRTVNEVVAHTISWLNHQGFIASFGSHPCERVVLAEKGVAALNMPSQLKHDAPAREVGTELLKAKEDRNWSAIGDLVGGVIGGFWKSMSGG